MSDFKFVFADWIQSRDPDPRRAGTSAEFMIIVDGVPVTRLLDTWSKTVTDKARLPLYMLAEWFAVNWWRIQAEVPPEGSGGPSPSWRLSHDLPAIGGGFIWPKLRFASDGYAIQVSARALKGAVWEPVRHLIDVQPPKIVTTGAFNSVVDEVVVLVLRRLQGLGVSAEPLATIWQDVMAERADPEVADWRVWEARLGYDPGDAPDDLMNQLSSLFTRAGKSAAAEVAPIVGENPSKNLAQLDILTRSQGAEAALPMRISYSLASAATAPWEAARDAAHRVRDHFGHGEGPLTNADLTDALGMVTGGLDNVTPSEAPIGLGVANEERTKAVLHFRKRNLPGIRFEAARFLADSIVAPVDDRWLPLTDRASARQKFQRAFSAELLAPIDEILSMVGGQFSTEKYDDLGEHFGVSPLAIRSQLANHGHLSPDQVTT